MQTSRMTASLSVLYHARVMVGCSGDQGGTTPVGGACLRSAECEAQAGREVVCACAEGSGSPQCMVAAREGELCSMNGTAPPCDSQTSCLGIQSSSGSATMCARRPGLGDSCFPGATGGVCEAAEGESGTMGCRR